MSDHSIEIDLQDDSVSGEDLKQDTFTEVIQKNILISPKNAILYTRSINQKNPGFCFGDLNDGEIFHSFSVSPSSSVSIAPEPELEITIDPFFIIPQKFLTNFLEFPPKVDQIIKNSKITAGTLFALGQQQTYLQKDFDAIKSFEKSLFIEKTVLCAIWKNNLQLRNLRLIKSEEVNWCGRRKGMNMKDKCKQILNEIKGAGDCTEKFWMLMDAALAGILKVGKYLEAWQYYAAQILSADKYFGYLAWGSSYLKKDVNKGLELLHHVCAKYPSYPHSFILIWHHFYIRKEFLKSYNIIAECFVKANSLHFSNFSNLIFILYIKSLCRLKRFNTALEMLERKYTESENNLLYLYKFGKICIKSKTKKFRIAGISALKEILRWVKDFPKANFWFAIGCYKAGRLKKAQKHFHRVLYSISQKEVRVSIQVQKKLKKLENINLELDSYKEKMLTEKFPKLYESEHSYFNEILKLFQCEEFVNSGNTQSALDILKDVNTFEAFLLVYNKIIQTMEFESSKKLLLGKLENLKSISVPVFEFVEACIMYSDFLKTHEQYEESLSILKSLFNFFPNFKENLNYVRNCSSSFISVKLIGLSNLFETSLSKKKDMVLKAVKGKSIEIGSSNLYKFRHKKVASMDVRRTEFDGTDRNLEKEKVKNMQLLISSFAVYTSPKVLLKCAEVLERIVESDDEIVEVLEDFLLICQKPFYRTLALKMLEKYSKG